MTSGPDDERRRPTEPTFADVMNAFSFDSARAPRRRRWGRRRPPDGEPRGEYRIDHGPDVTPATLLAGAPSTGPIGTVPDTAPTPGVAGAAAVRPYAWT